MSARRPNILLGVTGSVAAKLTPKLVSELKLIGGVEVVATDPALYFWKREETGARLWTEADEWPGGLYVKDQPVPHIALGDRADVLVIAPLTANTLTKLALGIADNLLTCTAYAWPDAKPLVIAPAMNTRMWQNGLTRDHLAALSQRLPAFSLVPPAARRLACGTTGIGAMADIAAVAAAVRAALERPLPAI